MRQQERQEQGLAASRCILCIEDHHTAGKNHDSLLTAPLCEMHHDQIHELLRRGEVSLLYENDPAKRAVMALRAMAVYGRAQADTMDRIADSLEESGGTKDERST